MPVINLLSNRDNSPQECAQTWNLVAGKKMDGGRDGGRSWIWVLLLQPLTPVGKAQEVKLVSLHHLKVIFGVPLITLHFLSLQRPQMPLSSCLMSGCVCYVDGNLPAEHNDGKFPELGINCTELVITGGFSSVASEPLSHSEKWRPCLGKESSCDSAYFVAKIS